MSLNRLIVVVSSICATLICASAGVFGAAGGSPGPAEPARTFGQSAPFAVSDLPTSALRRDLESLPPRARDRALSWLHEFDFPAKDVETLRADKDGAIFYVDAIEVPKAPQEPTIVGADTAAAAPAAAVDSPLTLHSRPGAANTVYLDFNGHTLTKTAWNALIGVDPLVARPFDLDANPTTFSTAEATVIAEIWHRVAEDFAAFDIDVTTEQPATFNRTVGRIVITSRTAASGKAMPYSSAGGIAYQGVWGLSNYASYYSPVLIYFNNLANDTAYIAEACAHEFGHNLGLSHDGTATAAYYAGHGTGYTSWAPIMGNSYYNNVTQWSKGEYRGANNTQDDIAIIGARLGLLADDHGNTPASATALLVSADGAVLTSNPQTDPGNRYPENKGVIGRLGDQDVFAFNAGAGALTLKVNPAWDAFYRTERRGANLDIRATLLDAQGSIVAQSEPTTDTYAQVSATVPAGVYYLEVAAVGSANYSSYASQGRYFISGQVPPAPAINRPPVPAFNYACAGLACTLTDTSTDSDGQIASRAWTFGDGSTASAARVAHTYAAKGTYSVGLTATDDAGAGARTARSIAVTNAAPTAAFTASCTVRSCTFTDRSSDSDGSLIAWSWNFGDGTVSTARQPTHSYAVARTYSVRLTVTDNLRATATYTGSATPTPPPNVAPKASFTAACTRLRCTFTDTSKDSDGSIQARAWDFGNGITSTLKSPTVTYALKGSYRVQLRVTDNGNPNLSATTANQLNVLAK